MQLVSRVKRLPLTSLTRHLRLVSSRAHDAQPPGSTTQRLLASESYERSPNPCNMGAEMYEEGQPGASSGLIRMIRYGAEPDSISERRREGDYRAHKFRSEFAPPSQTVLAELRNSRAAAPLSILQDAVRRKDANVMTVFACLQAYSIPNKAVSLHECIQRVRADQPGKTALRWLLVDAREDPKTYPQHVRESMHHNGFLYELCHDLILEGDEEMLWTWMSSQNSEFDNPRINDPGMVVRWRGFLLRHLVACKLQVALRAVDPSADGAFDAFTRMRRLKVANASNPTLRCVSTFPAVLATMKRLASGHFSRSSDHGKWDNFAKLVYKLRFKNEDDPPQETHDHLLAQPRLWEADLQLLHPKDPSAELALQIVRAIFDGEEARGRVVKSSNYLGYLGSFAHRTAWVLKRLNMYAESREAYGVAKKLEKVRLEKYGDDDGFAALKRRLRLQD